ncbi:GNAT family N-acetyltransferase [Streptomyces sp. NPDC054775]
MQSADIMLRASAAEDLPFIYRSERAYVLDVQPEDFLQWIDAVDRNLDVWVSNLSRSALLEWGEEQCGYALWGPTQSGAELVGFFVTPSWRGHGLGKLLLQWFAEDAAAQGYEELRIALHRRSPAGTFFEKEGYMLVDEQCGYFLYRRLVDVSMA